MKRHLLSLVLFGLLLTAPTARASEIIVIEVPSLIGTVSPMEWITGTVTLPGNIEAVLSASLELSGHAAPGVIYCPDQPPYPSWVYIGARFRNSCINSVPGNYWAWLCDSDGQYDLEGEVEISGPVVWDPFMGSEAPWWCWTGQLSIEVWDYAGYPLPCHGDPDPFLEITSARLILEVEPIIPTQAMGWGALKSLYR